MTKGLIVAGLALLNVVLGAGVAYRLGVERPAQAQIGVTKTDWASVAGATNGQTAIYVLDVNSGWLGALRLDVTNKRLDAVAQRQVAQDLSRIQ